jgi:nitrite reductase (NADH) large subunit
MKIVIAGGGPAALESAAAARKVSAEAVIDIYSAEEALPYRRPALSGLLGAGKAVDEKTFFIKPAAFFEEQRIGFHGGIRAAEIRGRELILASGEAVEFDKLILACGSDAVRPPIEGVETAYTLRSADDMKKLNAKLDDHTVKNVVIIGGGVLGLEIADSLLSRQINTVVFEMSPRLFPGKLADKEADELAGRLEKIENLKIIFNCQAVKIAGDKVFTADGREFPADIVICATGSRPDLKLAESAGLECGRGVKVDGHMRSSDPDIFAAGDTAEYNGRCFNLYMDAVASGKVAGANAAGEETVFTAKLSPTRLMALGEKLVF